jgi:hypothetical protein
MNKYLLNFYILIIFIALNCGRETPTFKDPEDENPVYTEIKGYITANLTLKDSPYYVVEDIYIDSSFGIMIEPGVELLFFNDRRFYINGNLMAIGTKEKPIIFSTFEDSTWGGIRISNTNNSELTFCIIEKINIEGDTAGTGSVRIVYSEVKIENSIFRENRSTHGGAVYIFGSSVVFANNIFRDNFSVVAGGAILSEISNIEIVNNTFYKNNSLNFGGGIILSANENNFIQNNIFYMNTSQTGDPRIEIWPDGSGINDTAYNFLAYGVLNPNFISENDLHLRTGSPCINAGNPDSSFNDYNGSRNDQGAYGGPLGNW